MTGKRQKKAEASKKSFAIPAWAVNTNIYEVNIRQYTPEGTFKAFTEHLPRLQRMGIATIWLMPVTPISKIKRQGSLGSYYACSHYKALNPEFGNARSFKALIKKAHALGMQVMIDWVANHTGADHIWTQENAGWYVQDEQSNFTERNGWVDVYDLDYTKADMRAAMIDAMQYWILEYDIDGFRCDMAHLVPLDFWADARKSCDAIKPLCWLAETDESSYHEVFDISYAWKWMHVSEQLVRGHASAPDLMRVLQDYFWEGKRLKKLMFTSNHDENSWNGTEYEKYGHAAKTLAAFTLCWPGIPLIYSGQEIPNHRRLLFFDKDHLGWPVQQPSLETFYSRLLHFFKRYPHDKEFVEVVYTSARVIAFILGKQKPLFALFNFSPFDRERVIFDHSMIQGVFENLSTGISYHFNGKTSFELQAWEYLLYVQKTK